MIRKKLLLILFTLLPFLTIAQENIEMADNMRQEGKIYVVVAVLSVIFVGILIFLILLERKISRLEKLIRK
ncbi:MAG: CcmD family protein [Bacteroidia bacterium]|nr:CcmD family protein [Bacteroidia bacterium]MCZ2277294.1 CcmD family protein [Bacteroidia bacterium]